MHWRVGSTNTSSDASARGSSTATILAVLGFVGTLVCSACVVFLIKKSKVLLDDEPQELMMNQVQSVGIPFDESGESFIRMRFSQYSHVIRNNLC